MKDATRKTMRSIILLSLVLTIFENPRIAYASSTQWYFRNTNATTGPTAKASTDTDSFPSVPADKNTPKDMTVAIGTAQTSVAGVYSTSTTPLYTMARIFVGPALAAQTLTGGQAGYKCGIAIKESSLSMNLYARWFVYVWRSGSGNVKTIGGPVSCTVEHGTTEKGCVITFAGASGDFSILANDRIVVECWFDIRNTKATSYTATDYYDGTTDVIEATATSNAAGFFYCPQTLTLESNTYTRSASASETMISNANSKYVGIRSIVASETIGSSTTRAFIGIRTVNTVETIVGSASRSYIGMRIAGAIEVVGSNVNRIFIGVRSTSAIEAMGGSANRYFVGMRVTSASESMMSTSDRIFIARRVASASESPASYIATLHTFIRTASGYETLSSSTGRTYIATRLAANSESLSSSANRIYIAVRGGNNFIQIGSSTSRIYIAVRNVGEPIYISSTYTLNVQNGVPPSGPNSNGPGPSGIQTITIPIVTHIITLSNLLMNLSQGVQGNFITTYNIIALQTGRPLVGLQNGTLYQLPDITSNHYATTIFSLGAFFAAYPVSLGILWVLIAFIVMFILSTLRGYGYAESIIYGVIEAFLFGLLLNMIPFSVFSFSLGTPFRLEVFLSLVGIGFMLIMILSRGDTEGRET